MPGSVQAILALFALSWMSQDTLACNWDAVRHSTAYIFVDVIGQETGAKSSIQGTGFVVSRLGYVLTASHVLRDWMKQRKSDKDQNPIRATLWDRPGFVSGGQLNLQVINPGDPDSEDVALLKLPDPESPQAYSPAPLCSGEARVGAKIFALGFPWGQSFQIVEGTLGTQNAPGGRWAAASSFAAGMSGGPVYNSSCNLIGLVKGGLVNSDAVQWVTPIGHAENFLRIAGVSRECVHNAHGF